MGRVAHLLGFLIKLGDLLLIRQEGIDDDHAPLLAPQDPVKLAQGAGDVGEMMRSDAAGEHGEGAGREGEVFGVGLAESDVLHPAFFTDELLGLFQHLHGQIGGDNAAHQRREVEGGVPAAAGDIEQDIFRRGFEQARRFDEIIPLSETAIADIAVRGSSELFPDLVLEIAGHGRLLHPGLTALLVSSCVNCGRSLRREG